MENIDFDEVLRKEVEEVSGRRICDRNACEELSWQIGRELREGISYQTIRRYWEVVDGGGCRSL